MLDIKKELKKRLYKAAVHLHNQIKLKLNRSQPYRITKGRNYVGLDPSLPGESPKKIRGDLIKSIAYEIGDDYARVGTNLEYGKHLELGTQHIAPRPYLRSTMQEEKDNIKRILGGE